MTTQANSLPHVAARSGHAPVRRDRFQQVQTVLFIVGGALLPFGIVVICLGWYGIAHTAYEYNQLVYLISGGFLGVGITFMGGFLYFGAWIARTASAQRESSAQLSESLRSVTEALLRQSSPAAQDPSSDAAVRVAFVVAGTSTTVHRVECGLIEGRTDLKPALPGSAGLVNCRVCLSGGE